MARDPHDRATRLAAKAALKYPPVRFDGARRQCVADGIACAVAESGIAVHALAIGHDHGHAIVGRHAKPIGQVVGQFKGRATQAMRAAGCHPLQRFAAGDAAPPSPSAERCWSVFINDLEQLAAAIAYVERHPLKEGLPIVHYPFVTPYRF